MGTGHLTTPVCGANLYALQKIFMQKQAEQPAGMHKKGESEEK